MKEYLFEIAEWKVRVRFANEYENIGMNLLTSMEPFSKEDSSLQELFTITVDQSIEPLSSNMLEFVKDCETGNGIIRADRIKDGGYQYITHDTKGKACALLIANADFNDFKVKVLTDDTPRQHFGLNNAMMLAYAFAGACNKTLLIHASLVRKDGYGYAFLAKSGTGKSTQTSNWLKAIPGCDLMNDDNPVLRMVEGKAMIYGSPWSGKTPCYRQVKAPLGALTLISRDATNWVEKAHPINAFGTLISSCSAMKWDKKTFRGVSDTVSAVVSSTGNYILHCTKDPESALICYETIGHRSSEA